MRFLLISLFSLFSLFFLTVSSVKADEKVTTLGGPGVSYSLFYTSLRSAGPGALIMPTVLPSGNFTFEAWVKLDSFTTTGNESRYIFSQRSNLQYNYTGATLWVYGSRNMNNGTSGIIRAAVRDGRDERGVN